MSHSLERSLTCPTPINAQELTPVDVDSPAIRKKTPLPIQIKKSVRLQRTPSRNIKQQQELIDSDSDDEQHINIATGVLITQFYERESKHLVDQRILDNEKEIVQIRTSMKTPIRKWAEEFVYGNLNGSNYSKVIVGNNNEANTKDEITFTASTTENDPGYDTDLDTETTVNDWLHSHVSDPTGSMCYIDECNKLGVLPASYFVRHIQEKEFIMKNHGLGPLGARAIATPLENNCSIEKLNLEGNDIQCEGATYLCNMLKENLYICELYLAQNGLGNAGARQVFDLLCDNTTISKVDLSGNNMHDTEGESLSNMLESNTHLKFLYLRNNCLAEFTSQCLKEALSNNESLELLDLSWNHIRTKGAEAIADGVAENVGLKYLNLSMNGFGVEGAKAMGKALTANRILRELDLSWNRIPQEGAVALSKGLNINDILRVFRIGNNPLTATGAYQILTAIATNDSSDAEYLDMVEVFVSQSFIDLKKTLEADRNIIIIHGGIQPEHMSASHIVQYDFESAFERDPMTILKRYAESQGLRLYDLFRQFDKDQSNSVSHEEFVIGVRSTGIDLSEQQITRLIKKLDRDGDGEIDYGELIEGDKRNRQTKRMIEVVKVENQKKKEEAEKQNMDTVTVKRNIADLPKYIETKQI